MREPLPLPEVQPGSAPDHAARQRGGHPSRAQKTQIRLCLFAHRLSSGAHDSHIPSQTEANSAPLAPAPPCAIFPPEATDRR